MSKTTKKDEVIPHTMKVTPMTKYIGVFEQFKKEHPEIPLVDLTHIPQTTIDPETVKDLSDMSDSGNPTM